MITLFIFFIKINQNKDIEHENLSRIYENMNRYQNIEAIVTYPKIHQNVFNIYENVLWSLYQY